MLLLHFYYAAQLYPAEDLNKNDINHMSRHIKTVIYLFFEHKKGG